MILRDQPSLIARFEPPLYKLRKRQSEDPEAITIIGSHQDTVNGGFFSKRAPGADDDGSGTTTILEAFTILCENKFQPDSPVEFHWYSAEEVGLRGSQDIAKKYQRDKVHVRGMIQFDMTGYKSKQNVYGIITDYTDPKLTDFLRLLATKYGGIKFINTKCNYGCSDHASWNKAGFRSAFPFEAAFKDASPYIHGAKDTVEHIDFDHMKEFVKLALGWAYELSD